MMEYYFTYELSGHEVQQRVRPENNDWRVHSMGPMGEYHRMFWILWERVAPIPMLAGEHEN